MLILPLDVQIESVLFHKGEPVSVMELAKILKRDEPAIREAISVLRERLDGKGIVMMEKDGLFALGTAPEMSELFEELTKEELSKDIGRAGLETLTIVLYRGPITRGMVDYIRGVNSTFILRRLLVRGLIEKVQNPDDQRSFLYRPTFDLLRHLGIKNVEELPEHKEVQEEIKEFEGRKEEIQG